MVFENRVIRKISYQSWFLVYQRVLPQARLLQHLPLRQEIDIIQITVQQSSQVKVWIDKHGETRTPEWLQEFRENLVDERVPEHRDSHASSSHEPFSEPLRSADLSKHRVFF